MYKKAQLTQSRHHVIRIPISAVRLVSRWLLLVGILALVFLSADYPSAAQGQKVPLEVRYSMDISNPRTTLCKNAKVTYLVKIKLVVVDPTAPNISAMFVNAVSVTATIDSPPNIITDITSLPKGFQADVNEPYTVPHTFQALNKTGSTTIHFTGMVRTSRESSAVNQDYPVQFHLPVKVIDCKYKITAISRWAVAIDSENTIELLAVINSATLQVGSTGQFTGTADVVWHANIHHASGCTSDETLARSKATLTGEFITDADLKVTVVYVPTVLKGTVTCKPHGQTVTYAVNAPASAAPLYIVVSPMGASFSQSQDLVVDKTSLQGFVAGDILPVGSPAQ